MGVRVKRLNKVFIGLRDIFGVEISSRRIIKGLNWGFFLDS